jgi:hypothetical protein
VHEAFSYLDAIEMFHHCELVSAARLDFLL